MPKTIDPLNPEEVKAALPVQDNTDMQPAETPGPVDQNTRQTQAGPAPIQDDQAPVQENSLAADDKKRKRYKVINLAILAVIVMLVVLGIWHFWAVPNKKSGKTVLGTTDKTTLAGLNKDHATGTLNGYNYPDYKQPINIPSARQTYSIENGGYKYTFQYLKNSEKPKYTDTDFQDVSTPAGPYSLDLWIKPSDQQKQLACDKYSFIVRTLSVFGQDYPLCGRKQDTSDKLSGAYSLRFFYLGKWHEFFLANFADSSYFTDQLAVDVLTSLKVEKL